MPTYFDPSAIRPARIVGSVLVNTTPDHQYLAGECALDYPVESDAKSGQIPRISRRMQMGNVNANFRIPDSSQAPLGGDFDPDFVNYDVTAPLRSRRRTLFSEINTQIKMLKTREHRARACMNDVRMQLEVDWVNQLTTVGNWGAGNTATLAGGGLVALAPSASNARFGAAGATEFTDLRLAAELAADQVGGRMPDGVIFGITAWRALKSPTEYNASGRTTADRFSLPDGELIALVQQRVGIDEVKVHRVRQETAAPGAASAEAYLFGDNVVFYYNGGAEGINTSALVRVNEPGAPGGDVQTAARNLWMDGTGIRAFEDEIALYQGTLLVGQHGDAATISTGFLLSDCAP